MFAKEDLQKSGKHMICDIKDIQNKELLYDTNAIRQVLLDICEKEQYSILGKLEYSFEPQGCTILFLLSESHISVHTFPERNYIAFDLYTCRNYTNNSVYESIYKELITLFSAKMEMPMIINRSF